MHCKLGKDCYGLFTQEAKQKHQILMACPSSHLLLQLSGTSTVLAGERQNQLIGSWQVNKRQNVFSIPCFKISMLRIWEADLVRWGKDADWSSLGFSALKPTLCPPWWGLVRSPVPGVLRQPRDIRDDFFQGELCSKMIFKSLHPLSPETNISHPPKVSKMQMQMMPQCDYTFPNSSQETQLKTTHATQKYPGRSPRNTCWCYHHTADSTTKKSPFCFISKLLLSPNALFPSHCPVDPSSGSHVGGRCRSAAVTLPVGF